MNAAAPLLEIGNLVVEILATDSILSAKRWLVLTVT